MALQELRRGNEFLGCGLDARGNFTEGRQLAEGERMVAESPIRGPRTQELLLAPAGV